MRPLSQVQLLGDFRLVHHGSIVKGVSSPRQQALLAYLALHRDTPQLRQHLAFLFWPDSSEDQAHTNLRNLFHQLRRNLPDLDHLLCISPRTVQWRNEAGCWLDVAAFESAIQQADEVAADQSRLQAALEAAVALYTGDLLPNLYADWVLSARERLRTAFLQLLDRLLILLEEQRDYTRAVAYAVQLLQHDPLHEPTYRRLMQLYVLNQDRTGALRIYATCRALLQRELDVEPTPETTDLYQRLVNQEDCSALLTKANVGTLAQPVVGTPLVGRQGEWQQLVASWQRATAGQSHVVLIAGEAGIGKTRLAEEFMQWTTRQGISTTVARCYAIEERLSYAPVVTWLRSHPLKRVLPSLEPVWQAELARLLPELQLTRSGLPPPEPLTQGWQRQRLFDALARGIMAARPPLLLVLDDIQWCDTETLEWLHYLLRTCGQARFLVVVTLRVDAISTDHPLVAWQQALLRQNKLHEIHLGPLDQAQTAQLAALVAGQPLASDLATLLYRETEGHPLFIVEMTNAGSSVASTLSPPVSLSAQRSLPLSLTMQRVIEARLNQLSVPTREVLNLAAVIGREFTVDLLSAAGGIPERTLADALDEALQRRIIREQGTDGYDFSHDRIRAVAYASLSHIRRRLLHRQVITALETIFRDRLDDLYGRLALHCEQADLPTKALGYYRQAAETALHFYAHQDATHLLAKALHVLQSQPATPARDQQELQLQLMLGSALAITSGYAANPVEQAYSRAWALAQQVGDATQQFAALWGLRLCYSNAGQVRLGVTLGEQLLDLALAAEEEELQIHARRGLGGALFNQGNFVRARAIFEQGVALYKPHPHHTQRFYYDLDPGIHCLTVLTLTLWMLGYPKQALARYRQTMALIDALAHPASTAFGLNYMAWFHRWCGAWDKSLACAEASLVLCDKHGFAQLWGGALINKGAALAELGQVDEGIALLEQGVAAWQATGAHNLVSYVWFMLANACVNAGHYTRALTLLDEALADMVARDERRGEPELHLLRGRVIQVLGASDVEVEACYQRALDLARTQHAKLFELRAAIHLGRLWQQQGRLVEAKQLVAGIYDWFTEGFDTPDLQQARILLNLWL